MSTLQKILLAIVVLALIVLIIIFWGSMFSVIMTSCLIFVVPIYLFNRFVNTDKSSDFIDDDNG